MDDFAVAVLNSLKIAQDKAIASKVERVVVRDNQLIRIGRNGEITVMKTLPPRTKVNAGVKRTIRRREP